MTIPYITPKQQQIPKLIYTFRILNRLQIQKILKHKDKRRINSWLKDLVEKEYLEKIPKDSTFEERTKLTIYRIGMNGIRFLNTQDDCLPEIIKKLYKDKNRSDNFINQCILLADSYISLQNKTEVIMGSDFVNTDSPFHFLTDLNPNLVYKEVKKHKKEATERYYLLEVFEATLPRYSIRKRIRTYLEFYYSNQWEDNINKHFPTLKFICPTKTDLIYAKRLTKKLLEENQNPEDLRIKFATSDEVKKFGINGEFWEEVE